jgi:hypothetical protein
MIVALSNGENNSAFQTNDYTTPPLAYTPFSRMGLFSLSNRTARVTLKYELANQRMNDAERSYLNKYGNEWVKLYIQNELPKPTQLGVNKWWKNSDGVAIRSINDSICAKSYPFNLDSPEVSIAIGTIEKIVADSIQSLQACMLTPIGAQ